MSKSAITKFRKNDYYDDEESFVVKPQKNKRQEKRFERALRTKDISALVEEDDGLDPIDIEDDIYIDQLNWNNR